MFLRRRSAPCRLSEEAARLPGRGSGAVRIAVQFLLQSVPPTVHLDVGALSWPAGVSGAGSGAGVCPACRADTSGGAGLRDAAGSGGHLWPLASVVARPIPADPAMAVGPRALSAAGG